MDTENPGAGIGLNWVVVEVRPFPGKGCLPGVLEGMRRGDCICTESIQAPEGPGTRRTEVGPLIVRRPGLQSQLCSSSAERSWSLSTLSELGFL